jgi:hypothetical protein
MFYFNDFMISNSPRMLLALGVGRDCGVLIADKAQEPGYTPLVSGLPGLAAGLPTLNQYLWQS